jgi:hypothetical protein
MTMCGRDPATSSTLLRVELQVAKHRRGVPVGQEYPGAAFVIFSLLSVFRRKYFWTRKKEQINVISSRPISHYC